ncbi:MAG: glyoxalase [Chloroflexi bacterium]|nr:MAG: glyoxalase [Chloroflexota bacterium]
MINRLSHATIYVKDQESALAFYTEKLGFEVRTDVSFEGMRWLTVGPKNQPDLEMVLMPIHGGALDEETGALMATLLERGAMGTGVLHTDDCRATYEALKAKGVEFISPPQEQMYGVEAILKDNQGNWFSLTQPRPQPGA